MIMKYLIRYLKLGTTNFIGVINREFIKQNIFHIAFVSCISCFILTSELKDIKLNKVL